jgi:ATP-dependent Clp protease ATP-binding subunit ClpA
MPIDPRKEFIETVQTAAEFAHTMKHEFVTLEHLLYSIIQHDSAKKLLSALEADVPKIDEELSVFLASGVITNLPSRGIPRLTQPSEAAIKKTSAMLQFSSRKSLDARDLLVRILEEDPEQSHAIAILHNHGITASLVKRYLSHGGTEISNGDSKEENTAVTNKKEAELILEKYCVNLNKQATEARIDPLIGRATEVNRMTQVIARRHKNNVVLVGEPGVGKTAVVEGLALKITRGEVPELLKETTIYSLDIGALIAGTKFRGEFEERMKQVLKALEFMSDSIVFIDEIHMIMGAGAGSNGSMDVANLLKPALSRGKIRCIGATTLEEFRKHFEKDRALLRRFKRIDIDEPSLADSKLILRGLREVYEKYHGLSFTDDALDAAVDLTYRYVTTGFLPDKAIDIIDNAGACQRILDTNLRKTILDVSDIEAEVAKVAKIPEKDMKEGEADKLRRLSTTLFKKVVGQKSAIDELVKGIMISRAGLRETDKTAGAYLFSGPTGVGKTEVAKAIAESMAMTLVRFDMSEYMEKHSVSKLIGSPPGYVGFADGAAGSGLLTGKIDSHPHCVLLLDEIEKAHPDIFNVLLQVMDHGSLTSADGKTVNFRNVILIMTTNAGAADAAKRAIGFGSPIRTDGDLTTINSTFAPEFRNRLDAIVRFNRLAPENITMIVSKFIDELNVRTAPRNVQVVLNDEAVEWLSKKGYDPDMGARPMKRLINNTINEPLAELMLFGSLMNGGTANVKVVDDKIVVE